MRQSRCSALQNSLSVTRLDISPDPLTLCTARCLPVCNRCASSCDRAARSPFDVDESMQRGASRRNVGARIEHSQTIARPASRANPFSANSRFIAEAPCARSNIKWYRLRRIEFRGERESTAYSARFRREFERFFLDVA